MNGLFLSFEGIDGAGKSTHIETLAQRFRAQQRQVTVSREPGGTALAESIRSLVLHQPMDALTEALLVFAARRDHTQQVIVPALARGDVVLCDRFSDASFAYQGGGRGLDWELLRTLERWVQGSEPTLLPAVTLWFDLDPAVAAQRLLGARVADKFESQSQAFFERVAQAYARRAAEDPTRFARIDAALPAQQVWLQVESALQRAGWLQ